jgi:hypothetical protein
MTLNLNGSLIIGTTNIVNELALIQDTIVRKYSHPIPNISFPTGQNQWLQRGCGITVAHGEIYLIHCTWDAWCGGGPINH